jgi:hypothetical protein
MQKPKVQVYEPSSQIKQDTQNLLNAGNKLALDLKKEG